MAAVPDLTMHQIFNRCQDQSVTEKKLAKSFWQNAARQGAWQDVEEVLAHTLNLEKVRGMMLDAQRP